MTKLLILTAGFGEGHNAAARNLAAAWDSLAGPGAADVVDLFALAAPRFNRLACRAYLAAINGTPRLWSGFYAWVDRSRIFPRHLWMLRAEMRALDAVLASQRPAVVCSTYPMYAFMLERLTRAGRLVVPYYNVVTDSITINSLWTRPVCDGWFVPNEETAEVMRGMGVPPARLHDLGFPVPAFFNEHAGDLAPLAAGRSRPAQVLGWTNEVPRLLMTHHIVISKAGGATTQEAIAARCPMLVNQIVPGQEEGNYELLLRHHAGALVETPDAVISVLRRAFADQGAVWSQWRAALAPLARPDASRAIAAYLLARAAITAA